MKIFKDSGLVNEVTVLDLGIVQAGDGKEYLFYVFNESKADLRDLRFRVDHPEVSVLEFPANLGSQKSSRLKLKWEASVTLKEALKTQLKVNGFELWQ